MERLWRRHKDAGFVLVAISLDGDPKKVPPFVSSHKFGFPVALDPKMTVADVLSAATKALGARITVTRFARLKVGEAAQ